MSTVQVFDSCPTIVDPTQPLDECRDLAQFERALRALSSAQSGAFYTLLEQVLAYSRRHYIEYQGRTNEREDLQAIRSACLGSRAEENAHLAFLHSLYILRRANLGLEQVRGRFGDETVNRLVEQRLDLYVVHGSERARRALDEPGLGRRAQLLFSAREEIDREHLRVSLIDGCAWYRTEFLLPKSDVDKAAISDAVAAALAKHAGMSAAAVHADVAEAARVAARASLQTHGSLEAVLEEVMQGIVDDPQLGVDTTVLTCPSGEGITEPELMHDKSKLHHHFRCLVVMRSAAQAASSAKVAESARKAIRGRMFQLKHKAAKNCMHAGLLFGVDVEKSADYMIYANEDSHYPGHKVARVFTGGRSPIKITVPDRGIDLPRGFSDLRCFRGRDASQLFSVREQRWVVRYAELVQAMLCETFRLHGVVSTQTGDESLGDA